MQFLAKIGLMPIKMRIDVNGDLIDLTLLYITSDTKAVESWGIVSFAHDHCSCACIRTLKIVPLQEQKRSPHVHTILVLVLLVLYL
jgi:hypothetical protein